MLLLGSHTSLLQKREDNIVFGEFGKRNGRALSRSPVEIYQNLVIRHNILHGRALR
jgi:hypothetical protein